jgi:hypothetical protein
MAPPLHVRTSYSNARRSGLRPRISGGRNCEAGIGGVARHAFGDAPFLHPAVERIDPVGGGADMQAKRIVEASFADLIALGRAANAPGGVSLP